MTDSTGDRIYAYPRLSTTDLWFMRLGGDGLGNLLFNWARCLSAANRYGWRMIWPTWFSYKPKNWRVNPYDVRTYYDLFSATDRYVTGVGKTWRLLRYPKVTEDAVAEDAVAGAISPGSVVVFRGMKRLFTPFLQDHAMILRELLAITRQRHLQGWRAERRAPIAIHVRRGDFITRSGPSETVERPNSLLPLDWYIGALQAVREEAGAEVPAWLFSDGRDDELVDLMALPAVQRVSFGSSIADMLALARSRFLIASGSSFSMWSCYLGQVPTLWHPGKMLQPLVLDDAPGRGLGGSDRALEFEWSAGDSLPCWISGALAE